MAQKGQGLCAFSVPLSYLSHHPHSSPHTEICLPWPWSLHCGLVLSWDSRAPRLASVSPFLYVSWLWPLSIRTISNHFLLSLLCLLCVFAYEYYKPLLATVEVKIGGGGRAWRETGHRAEVAAGQEKAVSRAGQLIELHCIWEIFFSLYEQILAVLGTHKKKWATMWGDGYVNLLCYGNHFTIYMYPMTACCVL